MKKRMEEVEVRTEKGAIYIEQPVFGQNDPACILISPEQIDMLVNWLQEAKEEAMKGEVK